MRSVGARWLGWLPFALACTPTGFDVYVRDRLPDQWIANANVLLYPERGPCMTSPVAGGPTDESGKAEIVARHCGVYTLWVFADGFETFSRELDSCEKKPVVIVLQRLGPESDVATPAVDTARAFLHALEEQDRTTLEGLLLDSQQASLFLGHNIQAFGTPCQMRLALVAQHNNRAHVEFVSYCENACRRVWRVVLTQTGESWRVHALEYVPE